MASRGSRVICWALALMAALAPLPFGSVDPLPFAALQCALLAVALAWVGLRVAGGQSPLPWRDPLLIGGAALLLYGLLQMIPLPPSLLDTIAPASMSLRRAYAPDASVWAPLSLYPYATWRSCAHVACWTLAALMARHCAADLKERVVVAGGLVAGGLFQAGYGLFEFISGRQHIFGYQKKFFTDVATGTFISRNNYAGYLEMAIPLGLALAMLALGRADSATEGAATANRRLAGATGQQGFRALVVLMGAFLMAIALLMSRSRMGIIATVLSLVAGGIALGLKGRSRRFAIAAVAVALVAGLFATQIDILPVMTRFEQIRGELGTGYGRLAVWREAIPMLAANPLFGTGLGTWEMAFSPYRTDASQVRVDFAHNDYLEFAAEAGGIGLLIFLGAAWIVLRRRGDGAAQDEVGLGAGIGLVALALHSMTDFHLSIPADALAAAVLAGLFLRADRQHGRPRAVARAPLNTAALSRIGWSARALALCVLLALAGLLFAAATPALAEIRSDPAPAPQAEETARNTDVASLSPDEDLCAECRMEPFNAVRWIDAAARARERLLKDVEVIVKAQAAGELSEPATRQYVARRLDAALALARRGLELAPVSGRGHLEAGLLSFGRFALTGLPPEASDDFDRALRELDAALALQPWRAASYRRVARLLSPLWEECGDDQRAFIAKVTRRTRQLDPWAADIKEAAARMGL